MIQYFSNTTSANGGLKVGEWMNRMEVIRNIIKSTNLHTEGYGIACEGHH